MKNKAKFFVIFLSLILIFQYSSAFASETDSDLIKSGNCGDNLTYQIRRFSDEEWTKYNVTISGNGDMYDFDTGTISPFLSMSIISVEISDNVTSIGNKAFQWCDELEIFHFPANLTRIGNNAFYDCRKLSDIVIPGGVTEIGKGAFSGCSGISRLDLPSNLTSVATNSFAHCSGLETITVEKDNAIYDSRDNCNAIIQTGTNTLVLGCKNTVIPTNVTRIGNMAFFGNAAIESVEIPSTIEHIVSNAWEGCYNINKITVDSENLKYDSRDNCNAIIWTASNRLITGCKNTVIPETVTSIGGHAFGLCKDLENIHIPQSVKEIQEHAFAGCDSLKSITVPSSVTKLEDYTFSQSGIVNIVIPKSITEIGDYAFYDCKNIENIYYTGSEEEWKKISIGSNNDSMEKAQVHYNCSGKELGDDDSSDNGKTETPTDKDKQDNSNGEGDAKTPAGSEELKPVETQHKSTVDVRDTLLSYFNKFHPDAVVKKTKFKSSDKKIAKVNKKGIIKGGKKTGSATITMYVKTQETVTKPNGKQKKKLSKWTEAGMLTVNNTGKQ